jgi:hypothetical protein
MAKRKFDSRNSEYDDEEFSRKADKERKRKLRESVADDDDEPYEEQIKRFMSPNKGKLNV